MPKAFAVAGRRRIGNYGVATETEGVDVPEEVAAQLEQDPNHEIRIERESPPPRPKKAKED